jgi:hypothetical protein
MSDDKKSTETTKQGARMVADQAPRLAAPEQRPLSPGEQKQAPRATPPTPAAEPSTQGQSGGSTPANKPATTQKTDK